VSADALKLTTYFGERDRSGSDLLADQLLDLYGEHRLALSVLLRGTAGFGRSRQLRSDRLLSLSEDLPMVSVAIDTAERIEAVLAEVLAIKQRGLVTLERVRLVSGEPGPPPGAPQPHDATKLTVYVGRGERAGRVPMHVAICDLLHRRGVAGASVLLGVDGTAGGDRARSRFFGANADVPAIVVAVAAQELITAILPELGALLTRPLLTLERLQICKRDGELVSPPPALAATDAAGRSLWQKLTIHSSQVATHDGHTLNLEIIRRLRAADGAGATSLRGIWGFHGPQAPHGDRLLQLRRHVPVVTVVIDTPDRIADAFSIIDELTGEHGLVTSEVVPAVVDLSGAGNPGEIRLAELDAPS
jgi:PII-like signaling protein